MRRLEPRNSPHFISLHFYSDDDCARGPALLRSEYLARVRAVRCRRTLSIGAAPRFQHAATAFQMPITKSTRRRAMTLFRQKMTSGVSPRRRKNAVLPTIGIRSRAPYKSHFLSLTCVRDGSASGALSVVEEEKKKRVQRESLLDLSD